MATIYVASTSGGSPTTAIVEQRWTNRANKATPVLADQICLLDSANSGNEVYSTLTQIISGVSLPTISGTPNPSNIPVWTTAGTIGDSGVTIDHSQNVTNVNTLTLSGAITGSTQAATKAYADLKFAISNNLSDGNSSTIRSNLGLGTAALKNATSSATSVASVSGSFTVGHIVTASDVNGSLQDGGATSQFFAVANNLSEGTASTMRTNLGLGTAAVKNSTGSGANVASVTGSFTVGHIVTAADTAGTLQDGGSTSQFLVSGNNLSDVASKTTSFNNLSPMTTTGDMIYYNGSSAVRLGVGTPNYVIASIGGVPTWAPAPAGAGYVNNATFVSNNGTGIQGSTPGTPINAAVLLNQTSGGNWSLNGDGVGMKCGTAGDYTAIASVPFQANSTTGGVMWIQFYVNGSATVPIMPLNLFILNAIGCVSISTKLTLNANDIVTVHGSCGVSLAYTSYYQSGVSTGLNCNFTQVT